MKTFGEVEPVRRALERSAPKIAGAFVFGCVAVGMNSHRSNIDVKVIGTMSVPTLYDAIATLKLTLELRADVYVDEQQNWDAFMKPDAVVSKIDVGTTLPILAKSA